MKTPKSKNVGVSPPDTLVEPTTAFLESIFFVFSSDGFFHAMKTTTLCQCAFPPSLVLWLSVAKIHVPSPTLKFGMTVLDPGGNSFSLSYTSLSHAASL